MNPKWCIITFDHWFDNMEDSWTIFNSKQTTDKTLYPIDAVRCIITGPSEDAKSVFLTSLILNITIDFGKIYNYSPSRIYTKIFSKNLLIVLEIKYQE